METVGVSTPVKIQLKAPSVAATHGTGCRLMGGAALVSGFPSFRGRLCLSLPTPTPNRIMQPDNCGFASLVEQEGTILEGPESNGTSAADGDKRVKRRLLMGMPPSLPLGLSLSPPSLAHCIRPELRAHVSQGQLDWDAQLL